MNFEYVKSEGISKEKALERVELFKKMMMDVINDSKKINPEIGFHLIGDEKYEYGEGLKIFLVIPEELQNTHSLDGVPVGHYKTHPIFSLKLGKHPEGHLLFKNLGKYDIEQGFCVWFDGDNTSWRYEDETIVYKIKTRLESWIKRYTIQEGTII